MAIKTFYLCGLLDLIIKRTCSSACGYLKKMYSYFVILFFFLRLIISFWMFKKIYDESIQVIKRNLDELKEWA